MDSTQRQMRRCDELNNTQLIGACRDGDSAAWGAVVRRFERLVYAIPLREGLGAEEAADVAQETFTALINSLDAIQDPDQLCYWLMTVARRQTWRQKTRARNQAQHVSELHEESADDTVDLMHALWVYEAVEQLDDPCRSLIQALFFDPAQPSYSEIAVGLGRPLGSVGPLRGRCLDRLRAILEEG